MKRFLTISLLIIATTFTTSFSYGQNWQKQPLNAKNDSLFATYSWEEHDDYHAAGGDIVLFRNGRFRYSEFYPLSFEEHAEGTYLIKKDTLILTSDLQPDNLKVSISYIDSVADNMWQSRLLPVVNKNGDTLYNAFYYINNDTSINGHYDPWLTFTVDSTTLIRNLKVSFYETNCGSDWIPITHPNKYLQATVLSEVKPYDRTYKILKNWKLKIIGDRLIDLSDYSFSQSIKQKTVTVSGKFDKSLASKDGYHFKGYIVDIDPAKAAKLNGHVIKVTGKESIVVVPMKNTDSIEKQERKAATKYILSPKIEIIN